MENTLEKLEKLFSQYIPDILLSDICAAWTIIFYNKNNKHRF